MTERIDLEKFRFFVSQSLERDLACDFGEMPEVVLFEHISFVADTMAIALRQVVWGKELNRIVVSHHLDWWEAVKERFAPRWFKARWPVKNTKRVVTLCGLVPGIEFDWPETICGYPTTMTVKLEQ